MNTIPEIPRYRRPPVLLPPMVRTVDSFTPSKKSIGHPKPSKQKTPVKSPRTVSQIVKEDIARYVLPSHHFHPTNFPCRVLRRSQYGSLPNIHEKFLSEELDFDFNTVKKLKYKTTDTIRERYFIDEEKQVQQV